MKKINAFVMAMLVSFAAMAQDEPKFGLKGGLNVSTLTGIDADWKTGFHLGGLAHIHLTPSFSLQPEVYYSSQGAKFPSTTDDKLVRNLGYINVPFLLQYNFANGFRLQGGPQVGFLVGASDRVDGNNLNTRKTSDFKAVDISVPLGLSYLGYSGFGVDARYNIGLTNVYKTDPGTTKNGLFQVGVFYLFDHNHKAKSR